jgi:hypothetical protein
MRVPRIFILLAVSTLLVTASIGQVVAADPDKRRDHRSQTAAMEAAHQRLEGHEALALASGRPSRLVAKNFKVLGHRRLGRRTPNGDVFFYDHGGKAGKFAYVGSWSVPCSGEGVKVVNVNNPRRPKLVARINQRPGISNEDMTIVRIGRRDVLGVGVQVCSEDAETSGGLALFDVTNPRRPKKLSFLPVPAGGVHELDMVVRADRTALALLAVPFVEFENTYFGTDAGGEFRIVDITRPRRPQEVSDWGIIADSSLQIFGGNDEISSSFQGLGYFAAHYDHSARAADGGMTAYLSYWDGGVLKLDISNPANPVLLARTTFGPEADGDAHSMVPYDVGGKRFIFQNDEDFDSLSPTIVTSTATGGTEYSGIEEPWAPTLLSVTGTISGQVFDAGDGCQASDYAGAAGKIVLVDTVDPFYVDIIPGWTVPCVIGDQVLMAAESGAIAMVSNLVSPDDAYVFFEGDIDAVQAAAEGMPVVQISDIDELAAQIRAAGTAVTLTLDPGEPAWGFLRIFDESQASDINGDGVPEYAQVGKFSDLPHVTGELDTPPGSWSIHNTEINEDRAYSSWYSHGIVALELADPTAPSLVGQFVPPSSRRFSDVLGVGPAEVWGVAFDPETDIVYASDMRTGLWIVRPVGPAAP